MEIWVNPECSKCRAAVTALDAQHVDYTVRYYLQEPPTVEELEAVLARLRLSPWDITRIDEPQAVELGMGSWPRDDAGRARWIAALAAHPVLIQRPIITAGDTTAWIARSPEAIRAALREVPGGVAQAPQ